MFTSMIQIENLRGAGEVLLRLIPDPFRSISHHHSLVGTTPTPLPRLQIDPLAKLFRGFNGSHKSGRIGIADGVAFLVPPGLREHASQFDLPGSGGMTLELALSAHRFFLHYRHSCAVHEYIKNRYRLSHHYRQIQLHGSLDFGLLACGDIGADGLRYPFHGLGGHFHIRQLFHLLSPMIERSLLTHNAQHATHPRRILCMRYIEFDIGWKLTVVAMRTQVVGTRYFGWTDGCKNRLGT